MQWASKQTGFTIVELLIVIVVIAILAAITIVSYNGITSRAHDASMQSSSTQIEKKIQVNQLTKSDNYVAFRSNLYGPDQLPYNREQILEGNDLTALSDVTCIEHYVQDGNDANSAQDVGCFPTYVINQVPQFNKKKLYISVLHDTTTIGGETTYISHSYWSNSKAKWVRTEHTKAPGVSEVITTTEDPCTPVKNIIYGPAYSGTFPTYNGQCQYTGP